MNEDHLNQALTIPTTSTGIGHRSVGRDLFKTLCHNTILVVTTLLIFIPLSCRDAPTNTQESSSINETSQRCSELPARFQSYDEAISSIKQKTYKFEDEVKTSESSWIRAASYYSCDGKSGYFLMLTDKKDYLFQGMPIEIWEGFKSADSFGKYYHAYIRDRYYMYVGKR